MFCCQGKQFQVDVVDFPLLEALGEDPSICFTPNHITDHDGNCIPYSQKPLQLTELELVMYADLVEIEPNDNVDFEAAKIAADYLGLCSLKTNLLKEVAMEVAQCTTNPSTALSLHKAYGFRCRNIMDFTPIKHASGVSLRDKLQFAVDHQMSAQIINREVCSETKIPPPILELLDVNHVVVAGGYALHLLRPEIPTSDLDIFVLNTEGAQERICKLSAAIEEWWGKGTVMFCKSGPGVVTVVGPLGFQPIQIIYSSAKSAVELLHHFDLNYIKIFFDGQFLYQSCGALLDWMLKQCSTNAFMQVRPERLAKAQNKGFKLDQRSLFFVQEAKATGVTFPVVLTPGLSMTHQAFLLNKMQMPVWDDKKEELVPFQNAYQGIEVLRPGMVERLVAETQFLKRKHHHGCECIYLKCNVLIQLPLCQCPNWKSDVSSAYYPVCICDEKNTQVMDYQRQVATQMWREHIGGEDDDANLKYWRHNNKRCWPDLFLTQALLESCKFFAGGVPCDPRILDRHELIRCDVRVSCVVYEQWSQFARYRMIFDPVNVYVCSSGPTQVVSI